MEDNEISNLANTEKLLENAKQKKFSAQEVMQYESIRQFILKRPHKEKKEFSDIVYKIDGNFLQNIHERILEISKSYFERLTGYPIVEINLYYGDKREKNFKTFESFLDHCKTNNNYIKRIQISYDIMMLSSSSTGVETYKILFDFKSGYAHHKTDQDNMPPFFIIKDFFSPRFEIEYVDYAVAQNFINAIEKYFEFKDIEKKKVNLFQKIQKNSHFIPIFLQMTFIFLSALVIYGSVKDYTVSTEVLSKFFVIAGASLIIGYNIVHIIGRSIERNVDMIHDLSTLDFTMGDKDLNNEYVNKNRKNKWRSVIKFFIVTVVQSCIGLVLSAVL